MGLILDLLFGEKCGSCGKRSEQYVSETDRGSVPYSMCRPCKDKYDQALINLKITEENELRRRYPYLAKEKDEHERRMMHMTEQRNIRRSFGL